MQFVRYKSSILILLLVPIAASAQSWTKERVLPFGSTDASVAFTIGNDIYCGGGEDIVGFYKFDPIANAWTKMANMPTPGKQRAFGVAFAIDGKGYVGTGQQTNNDQGTVVNDFWEYDTATNTWTQIASLPGEGRDGALAFSVGGKGYVGGGVDAASLLLDDFYSYDPTQNKWTQLNSLPEDNMVFASTFVIGDSAYIATGSVDDFETADAFNYDASSDTWNPIAPYPGVPRQAAVGFSIDGLGYVGLGMAQYSTVFSDFYSYNPKTGSWLAAKSFGSNAAGWAFAAATPTYGFVGGGWNFGPSYFNDFWEFNPSGMSQSVESLPHSSVRLTISQNPLSSSALVDMMAPEEGSLHFALLDMLGRTVFSKGETAVAAGEEIRIPLDANALNLSNGTYLIAGDIAGEAISAKLLVLR